VKVVVVLAVVTDRRPPAKAVYLWKSHLFLEKAQKQLTKCDACA
jgi:hypothetical protein